MGSWPSGIGAITLFVEDLAAAKQFYQDIFGLPETFEDGDSAVFRHVHHHRSEPLRRHA